MDYKHSKDNEASNSARQSRQNLQQNLNTNHQKGYSNRERTTVTSYQTDHDRKRIPFKEDVIALVEAIEESSSRQEKEASFRELQTLLGEVGQTIRNSEPDSRDGMQISPHTSDPNITNTDYKISPHIIESIEELEKGISDIEDEFNPMFASSRIMETSERIIKYPTSRNGEMSKRMSKGSDECLHLIEGSFDFPSPSQSFNYGKYKHSNDIHEDKSTRFRDSNSGNKRQDKENRSERYDNFSYYTPKRNYNENMIPKDDYSYREEELQNIQNEMTERRLKQKTFEPQPTDIRGGLDTPPRRHVDNPQELARRRIEPIESIMQSSLGHDAMISEQRKLKADEESNDFVCKTVIIQTVKKYPPNGMSALYPVSRILTSASPDTTVYQETLYDEKEKDGFEVPKRTLRTPQKHPSQYDDNQERWESGTKYVPKSDERQKRGITDHVGTKTRSFHDGTKDETIHEDTKDLLEDSITSEELLSTLGVDELPGYKEKVQSDKFIENIEKSGKGFKSKVMQRYPSATDVPLELSTEVLKELGPTDDEEWDEYLALAQTVSKEQTLEPKRSISFHR
ncbi:uncharacterized protein [Parasteatoda tepidariorum]|uniref:uncharacterized protein n=1 Tax=Parasteatoda tepidariorum TaxID=114398 RepID=UPI0039BC5550